MQSFLNLRVLILLSIKNNEKKTNVGSIFFLINTLFNLFYKTWKQSRSKTEEVKSVLLFHI